jgi:hypothetical protein
VWYIRLPAVCLFRVQLEARIRTAWHVCTHMQGRKRDAWWGVAALLLAEEPGTWVF